tara:strand:+ start:66 stop:614 length:549 start_codon:yes stop_codon:yes gene_type:complete
VIVRSVHVGPRDATQWVERGTDAGDSLSVPEVVSGVHDEVGAKFVGKSCKPPLLATLPRRHMDVGEVQDPERSGACRQDAHLMASNRVEVALDSHAPDGGADADRPHDPEGREGGASERRTHGVGAGVGPGAVQFTLMFTVEPRPTIVPAPGLVPVTVAVAAGLLHVPPVTFRPAPCRVFRA